MKIHHKALSLAFLALAMAAPALANAQALNTKGQTYGQATFGSIGTYAGSGSSGSGSTSGAGSCSTLTQNGLNGIVNCILGILDRIVIVLMAAAVAYIVWGAFQMITSEEKRKSGRDIIVYGVIGLFAMISIWGFVNILDKTFNLRGGYIAPVTLHQ